MRDQANQPLRERVERGIYRRDPRGRHPLRAGFS